MTIMFFFILFLSSSVIFFRSPKTLAICFLVFAHCTFHCDLANDFNALGPTLPTDGSPLLSQFASSFLLSSKLLSLLGRLFARLSSTRDEEDYGEPVFGTWFVLDKAFACCS